MSSSRMDESSNHFLDSRIEKLATRWHEGVRDETRGIGVSWDELTFAARSIASLYAHFLRAQQQFSIDFFSSTMWNRADLSTTRTSPRYSRHASPSKDPFALSCDRFDFLHALIICKKSAERIREIRISFALYGKRLGRFCGNRKNINERASEKLLLGFNESLASRRCWTAVNHRRKKEKENWNRRQAIEKLAHLETFAILTNVCLFANWNSQETRSVLF